MAICVLVVEKNFFLEKTAVKLYYLFKKFLDFESKYQNAAKYDLFELSNK